MAPRGTLVAIAASGLASAQRLNPSHQHVKHKEKQTDRFLSPATQPDKQEDLVENLPGLSSLINVTHHAGRIALGDSNTNFLFYWHFQAAQNADEAPLIIWYDTVAICIICLARGTRCNFLLEITFLQVEWWSRML